MPACTYDTSTATPIMSGFTGPSDIGVALGSSAWAGYAHSATSTSTTGSILFNTSSATLFDGEHHASTSDGQALRFTTTNEGFQLSGECLTVGSAVQVTYTQDSLGNVVNSNIYVTSNESAEAIAKRRLKEIMKSNLLIRGRSRHLALPRYVTPQEAKARETLRDLISEREYRRYLTNGFVIIQAVSGKCYQVFNDQRHIKV